MTTKPRLRQLYDDAYAPELMKTLGLTNIHQVPRLEKIVLNMGVGSGVQEKKHVEEAAEALTQIAGQKAIITRARKSIAGFKLREGMPIGAKVTLRKDRMYEFLDRLVTLALPRVRDFRGISPKAFDKRGNYSLGLTEHLVFPELNPDKFTRAQGLNVAFVTSATKDEHAMELLKMFGMPFRKTAKAVA